MARQHCIVHRMVRSLHDDPRSVLFTWKCIRPGRATASAVQGYHVACTLELGRWSSRAVLRYVDNDHVGRMTLLDRVLESDGEV